MKNSAKIISFLFILFLALPLSALEVGDQAPPFVLTDLNRNYVFSRNIYGSGFVLVDFYATWCVNCNEELPYIEEIYQEKQDSGFQVFLMATDKEGAQIVKPYFEENPTPIPVLLDRYQKSVESFGVEELPTVFLIDPEGNIVYKATGFHLEIIDEIRAFLD